jgi:hypothetical protein
VQSTLCSTFDLVFVVVMAVVLIAPFSLTSVSHSAAQGPASEAMPRGPSTVPHPSPQHLLLITPPSSLPQAAIGMGRACSSTSSSWRCSLEPCWLSAPSLASEHSFLSAPPHLTAHPPF